MKHIDLACIIDDDPIFVIGTKRLMELAEICKSFMIFSNGKEALDALQPLLASHASLPNVIFLDLNMPVMDGWEFLDEFVKIPAAKEITVYIVTSSIDQRDIDKAAKYGLGVNYKIKPVTKKDLIEMFATA